MTPDQWVAAQNKLVDAARASLRKFWRTLDLSDPVAARKRLEAFWPALINDYGEVAATLAADRFEDETGLRAVMGTPIPTEQANANLRYGMGPMFGGDGEQASLSLLDMAIDRLVKQLGRDTYFDSIADHGGRVARIPVGDTCKWCLMLGSRGYIYANRRTAGELNAWHSDCDCRLAIEGEDVKGYDPDALYQRYLAARAGAEGNSASDILSSWRKMEGGH